MRRCRLLATALLALALVGAASPAWASGPVTREEFAALVGQARDDVEHARPSIDQTVTARALASEIESGVLAPSAVEWDGLTSDPDRETLRRLSLQLSEATTKATRRDAFDGIAANLESLSRALGRSGGEVPPSDAEALEELLTALPGGTAQAQQTNDWLGEQLRLLVERFAGWLTRMSGTGGDIAGLPFYAVLAVAGAVAVFFIARAAIAWRRGLVGRGRRGAGEGVTGPVVDAATDLPADALAFAERLAAEGRTRDAVRALYGGAARRLVEVGAIGRMRTRTNAELLRDVRATAPGAVAALAELTGRFEAAWYGHAEPGGTGFVAARASYGCVMDAATGVARPTGSAGAGGAL